MKSIQKLVVKLSAVSALFLLTLPAFAGSGSVTLAPLDPSAIPTLSSTMLIVLSVLLMLVAFRVSKQKSSGKFMVALLGASVVMASTGSVKLVSDLRAGNSVLVTMPEGQTVDIFSDEFNIIINQSGVVQRVVDIVEPGSCGNFPRAEVHGISTPDCEIGLILQPEGGENLQSCLVDCSEAPGTGDM